jgi:hypothetical protein
VWLRRTPAAKQGDEWGVVRGHTSAESLAKAKPRVVTGETHEELMPRTR